MNTQEFWDKYGYLPRVPRVIKHNFNQEWEFEHLELQAPVPLEAYSFAILHSFGTDGINCRIEAYPDRNDDVRVLLYGSFEICLSGLKLIAEGMESDGVPHDKIFEKREHFMLIDINLIENSRRVR